MILTPWVQVLCMIIDHVCVCGLMPDVNLQVSFIFRIFLAERKCAWYDDDLRERLISQPIYCITLSFNIGLDLGLKTD